MDIYKEMRQLLQSTAQPFTAQTKLHNLIVMALDTESILALLTLIVSCPPTLWLLYAIYRFKRRYNNRSMFPSPSMINQY